MMDAGSATHGRVYDTLLDNIPVGIQIVQLLYDDRGEPTDYVFLDVNSVYVEFLGVAKAEILGKKATDFNSKIEPEWFIKYGEIVKSGKSDRFEMFSEYHGCWFDVLTVPLGEQSKFAILYLDISERKRIEQTLRRSEEKYRTLFESVDDGFVIFEIIYDENGRPVDKRFVEGNQVYERTFGLRKVTERLLMEIIARLGPDWSERYRQAKRTGESVRFKKCIYVHGRWYAVQVVHVGVDTTQFALVFKDITESRLKQQRQSFLLQLGDTLHSLSDAKTIQDTATKLLVQHLGVSQASYTECHGESLIIDNETSDNTLRMKGIYERSDFSEGIDILLSGRDCVYSDILKIPETSHKQRDRLLARNVRAMIAVPIFRNGNLVATLSVRSTTPRVWSTDEVELVREIAHRTWIAIERARAEEALRQSEEKHRALFDNTQYAFVLEEPLFDERGHVNDIRFLEVNPAFEKQTGYKAKDFLGKTAMEVIPQVGSQWFAEFDQAFRSGQPIDCVYYGSETKRWYSKTIFPFPGGLLAEQFIDITERKRIEEELQESEKKQVRWWLNLQLRMRT